MKIAQIAPLIESVPPRRYGGTERIVSYLTEELVAQGHDVTLFASGDSVTAAELVPCCRRAIRLDPDAQDYIPYYMLMLDKVRTRAAEFDILHFHIDHLHFPLFREIANHTVTTLHGRQDSRDCQPFFAGFHDMPLVSISNAQRAPVPHANFLATVHNALPADLYRPNFAPGGAYLAFVGRISPEKGPADAIRIAQGLGIPLKMAAKVDKVDEAYFREVVQPLLAGPGIEFIGEVGDAEKGDLLRGAIALLFPICWPEPFGLTMIEAMACGTPVLAFGCGSVGEVMEEGATGIIVRDVAEAIDGWPRLAALDRRTVRRRFEARFLASRMARDYVKVYRRLVRGRSRPDSDGRDSPNGSVRVRRSDVGIAEIETHVE
jgi:glycosyltransferase involved in cell wall biosynthesis